MIINVSVYESTGDIYSDEPYVDHMQFKFDNYDQTLKFIQEMLSTHGKAVVVSVDKKD